MATTLEVPTSFDTARRDGFVERMLQSMSGVIDVFTVYLGHRLGYYAALSDDTGLTAHELAARTDSQERYAREWLEQQTVAGILEVDDERAAAGDRRYRLPAEHHEVLVDADSLNYLTPLALCAAGAVRPLPAVVEAYRHGGGVPYADYGHDFCEGQAAMNRPSFLKLLGTEWLPSVTDVHRRLLADPPARIADVGCGAGWSSIGMARAYPKVRVDGLDLDTASIELARANVAATELSARLRFEVCDAGDASLAGRYDLVTAFECVHDMSRPVDVLASMRRLCAPGGAVIVMDERVGEKFSTRPKDLEWLMYGWSVLHCLPVGMAEQPSVGTGTVMRPQTLRRYAEQAGYQDMALLPIDNDFFRFYRLFP